MNIPAQSFERYKNQDLLRFKHSASLRCFQSFISCIMFKHAFRQFVFTAAVLALVSAIPTGELEERASCTISSVSTASSISSCSSVTISAFTVPSGSEYMIHLFNTLPSLLTAISRHFDAFRTSLLSLRQLGKYNSCMLLAQIRRDHHYGWRYHLRQDL